MKIRDFSGLFPLLYGNKSQEDLYTRRFFVAKGLQKPSPTLNKLEEALGNIYIWLDKSQNGPFMAPVFIGFLQKQCSVMASRQLEKKDLTALNQNKPHSRIDIIRSIKFEE
ncbi:hypothetical protein WA026_009495 [Henosepilachna vigintioctopunctata]|uniref:LAGLIDADG homing endonuclease n=1 Tax=Henosepilachna vigintioctopunctata TaxID=420089 RepID=A0AAW1U3Y1_9CUCU